MFNWYKFSAICFVYLPDLPGPDGVAAEEKMVNYFPLCRWFKRGWTLQELVASTFVDFYNREWNFAGDKGSLQQPLSQITNIDTAVLRNSDLISRISVAKRMSWAAERCTTRVEDLSYCLFGIFDVNLPLIYGEGREAFIRLQEAIASENNDLLLFAWSPREWIQCKPNEEVVKGDPLQFIRDVFVTPPSEFYGCGNIEKVDYPFVPSKEFTMTNKGFHIVTTLNRGNGEYFLDLRCWYKKKTRPGLVNEVIRLLNKLQVVMCGMVTLISMRHPKRQLPTEEHSIYILKYIALSDSRVIESLLAHQFGIEVNDNEKISPCQIQMKPEHLWDTTKSCFITEGYEQFTALVDIHFDGERIHYQSGRISQELPLHCVVVFGLTRWSAASRKDENRELQPWAAIYQMGNDTEISRYLKQEKTIGFQQMLAIIGS